MRKEREAGEDEEKRSEKERTVTRWGRRVRRVVAATEKVKGEERKEKGARKRARARKTLKSISASPRKIRYRESRSLRERERVPK